MTVPVTTEWCGACGTESPPSPYAGPRSTCTTCALPLHGPEADRLRASAQDYRSATARGDQPAADRARREHADTRARLEAASAGRPPLPPAEVVAVDDARISASTLVTWAGAALLLAGGLAFATVVWQYAGGPGRIAILVVVTAAALLGADRLRRTAPTTAEAATTIAAGMIVVDAVAAYVAGYVTLDPTGWAAVTLLPSGVGFLLLSRRWTSRVAGVCGAALVGLGTVGLALWPLSWSAGLPATVLTSFAAAIVCAAVGYAARAMHRGAERAAAVTVAATVWVVQGTIATGSAALHLALRDSPTDGWVLVQCLAVVAFALLPLTVPVRSAGTGLLSGLAAAAPLVVGVSLATAATYALPDRGPVLDLVRVAVLALLVAVPTIVARLAVRPGASAGDRHRAVPVAVLAAPAYACLTVVAVSTLLVEHEQLRGALDLALLSTLLLVPVAALRERLERWIGDLLATAACVGLLASLGLVAPVWPGVPSGDAVAVAAAVAMLCSVASRRGTAATATGWAAVVAIGLSAVWGVTSVEWWSVPAAAVAAGVGVHLRRTGRTSSWLLEAPAAALLLGPTLLVALEGDRTGLRLGAVAMLATLVLLDSARRHRQGPAVVASAALAVAAGWVLVPHVTDVPSWAALAGSGALLLWVGFTWESRRATARHLAQSWSTWE